MLSYVPTMEDDGKFLTCRAENPVVPNSALEDRWRLLVYCKRSHILFAYPELPFVKFVNFGST